LLRQLVEVTSGSDRDMWLLQLVDSAVASSQSTDGTTDSETLTKLVTEVKASTENKEIISQARFVALTAEYSASLLEPNADYAAIQAKWIRDLETFVEDFGETRAAADAMLQLAISHEFAGQDEQAISSYERIVKEFPETDMAEKARGATRRLQSVGKPLELSGKGIDGRPFDLGSLRGNVVVVQYWATWCEPCKEDMKQLRGLLSQYARRKFAVVGVNLDNQPQEALSHLRSERMGWPQLYESGGLESGLAKQMGIFTLPVMLLIDESGAVVNRSVTIEELDAELKKRLSSGK
jgi:thiol-disulfide isomerase/thioredoxin